MNPQEQNGILDKLNFLHSDHDTYFEYNQEKLGSEIHASDVRHQDNLTMQSNMENIHHGSTGSGANKLVDNLDMENPHEYDSSQYVDEPGCVPIENPPVQTAPPLQTPTPTQPMTSHPVTAQVITQTNNMVQVVPGPSNVPVLPSASTVQVPATLQLNMVYTKPIVGPVNGQFLVQRYGNTNNLMIIPPQGIVFKTLGTPVITDNHMTNQVSSLNNQQPQMAVKSSQQNSLRRSLSPVKGPEPKKPRIIQNVQSGPAGPMNSRGQKNNPTMAHAHIAPPVDPNRFDISRYQPVRAQANNFQEEDDVIEEIPQIQGQNVTEPTQLGGGEQLIELELVQELIQEPEHDLAYCHDKINHDDVHEDQYLVSEEHTPALTEREVFDIIDKLGDSHKQAEVPMHKIKMMLQATENQTIIWGKHEVKNKRFNKSNKTDLPQGQHECRICEAQGVKRCFTKKDARMKHQRSHFWMVLNKPCVHCNERAERMDNHMDVCLKNPNAKKFKKTK